MRVLVAAGLSLCCVCAHAAAARGDTPPSDPDPARGVIVQALADGGDLAGQTRNLVGLAWPSGRRDEVVSARARLELTRFGDKSFPALREALNTVKRDYTEEVIVTTLGAQANARPEFVRGHLSIMLDALWVGNHGARVLALRTLARNRSILAVAPTIDCAIEDPSLAMQAIETLGAMRFVQARFYLEKIMIEGPPELRPTAASALAQIGGAALGPLKNALKAPSRATRVLAARVLLPAATEYDVGAIYEYLEAHGDDDAALSTALRAMADNIEKAIAARDAKAAATSPKDF